MDSIKEIKNVLETIGLENVIKIILKTDETVYKARQVSIKGETMLQFAHTQNNQNFNKNVSLSESIQFIAEKIKPKTSLSLYFPKKTIDLKITKKGKLLTNQYKNDLSQQPQAHDKEKTRLLNGIIPPLIDLGVMTENGEIKKHLFDKFVSIDRFVEQIAQTVKGEKKLNVIDFGCGKSYLSFVVYWYFQNLGVDIKITGLDLKTDVIDKCNILSEKYGYKNLQFKKGDINGYKTDEKINLVICLHACDTATDYALINAIRLNAQVILAVPCCQHEAAQSMKGEDMLTRNGIIKERFSALVTDALRAQTLTYLGYKTQIMEFIDFDNSPKNIMIKAVKSEIPLSVREAAKKDIEEYKDRYGFKSTLYDEIFQ